MDFSQNQMEPVSATQSTSSCVSSSNKVATGKRQQLADKLVVFTETEPEPEPEPTTTTSTTTTVSNEKNTDQLEGQDSAQNNDQTCCKENLNKEKYERVSWRDTQRKAIKF